LRKISTIDLKEITHYENLLINSWK